jgi:hypothetical protein
MVGWLIALIEIDIIGYAYEKKGSTSCHRQLQVRSRPSPGAIAASVSPPHSGSSRRGRTSSSPADGNASSMRRRSK